MSRLVSFAALIVAMSAAAPAAAADWSEPSDSNEVEYGDCGGTTSGLRGTVGNEPKDWSELGDECDPLRFEFGVRYWYSWGSHRMTVVGDDYASDDVSHILEAHTRIDDDLSHVYLKGMAGYSAAVQSNYTTPNGTSSSQSGRVAYAGADVGYVPWGDGASRFGGFVGYQYWNDSPDMGRVNFTGGSLPNDVNYNMLRLGISGRADLGFLDLSAEVAAVPYAQIWGTYGAFTAPAILGAQQSAASVSGSLWGAQGEIMARVHPTENWTIGVGGRAWYLTGQADVTFDAGGSHWVTKTTNFSTFRYGLLGEVTYKF